MKKRSFRSSLFIKIFVLCMICMLAPMITNLLYATYSAANALESEASASLARIVQEKKSQVDLVFELQFDMTDAWVNEPFVVDFFQEIYRNNEIDPTKRELLTQNLEKRFVNANGLYENIFFTYQDEVLVDGIGGNAVGYKMDPELEAYYYEQLQNPGPATGRYMYSPITGRPTIPVVNSIVDESTNQVLSVFVIPVDVNKLTEGLVQSSAEQNVGTMILDASGLVIASDKAGQALQLNFRERDDVKDFFAEMQNTGTGSGKYTLDGISYIASYVKHEQHDFYILSYIPVQQYMSNVDALKTGIIQVILLSVILSGIAVFLVVKTIVRPIKTIAQTAQQIAGGDLTAEPILSKNNDEVGDLARSFHIMLVRLREMVEQLRNTSEKIGASAEEFSAIAKQSSETSKQVSDAIKHVAAGTEEQSRNTSYSSDMIREITKGVRNVSENTQKVAASAALTTQKANRGAAIIDASISEIATANDNIQQMAQKIQRLGEHSKEIGKIVEVITQIADQTNLLALNAAIEAARAGEHGRGFAVVADEIRKLAEQAKESSNQINEMIVAILTETEQTVLSMDETVNQSGKGIAAIKEVKQTFDEIQRSVNGVTDDVQDVSSAAQQISAAIEQITSNIEQIARISSETAAQTQGVSTAMNEQLASSEDIAAASEEMARLAEELKQLVQTFKLQ